MWEELGATHNQRADATWWWNNARSGIVYECMKKVVTKRLSILDIGSGYGDMITTLTKLGTVTAIEPYDDAAAYLQTHLKIKTFNTTFESFSDTEQYDLISCFDVLEHIADDKKSLLKMETLIKERGLLVLTVPAYKFLWSKHDKLNHHYRRYSIEELKNKIPKNLIVRKATYFNSLLFPAAIIDKIFLTKDKPSYALNPNKIINRLLYTIFSFEKYILRFADLPFGVSILLIAEKDIASKTI